MHATPSSADVASAFLEGARDVESRSLHMDREKKGPQANPGGGGEGSGLELEGSFCPFFLFPVPIFPTNLLLFYSTFFFKRHGNTAETRMTMAMA